MTKKIRIERIRRALLKLRLKLAFGNLERQIALLREICHAG